MNLNVSSNMFFFIVACFVFLVAGLLFSIYLLVGAGCGAVGMFFILRWYEPFLLARKRANLAKKRGEVAQLERELYGKV